MTAPEDSGYKPLAIRRGALDSLCVFEITDYELDTLQSGGSEGVFLDFAIFCLSVALSFAITLWTTRIDSARTFTIFVVVFVVGTLFGVLLLILWFRSRRSLTGVVERIRNRLPPVAPPVMPPALAEAPPIKSGQGRS